ncbi:MAG: hypothetical protein D6705_12600 [Deltaproteobacteria bacterium]|nr:MAG: hypothetical protein D6705_12600 [Deltaproteobacteria bacterium]
MRGIFVAARRDLSAYLNSMWGYVIVAAVLLLDGILFNAFALTDTPRYSADVLRDFFYFSFGTTAIASILLTMRSFAEERQTGTMVLLDASPLTDAQIVAGKFVAVMAMLALLTLGTAYMPALVGVNGKVGFGHVFAGYLGLLLVGAACSAAGMFASSIARNQVFAAVLGGAIVVFLLTTWMLARVSEPPIKEILAFMSLFDKHFRGFMNGRIEVQSVVYYLSVTYVFLMLSTRVLALRRWR